MTATATPSHLGAPARFFLAAIVAIGLIVGAAATASATTSPAAQNVVGASSVASASLVGVSEDVPPATHLESYDSRAFSASATGVAAKNTVGTQGAGKTAGGGKTVQQINQRLQQHTAEQVARYESGDIGMSPGQARTARIHPRLAAANRGNVIDAAVKQAVRDDPFFQGTGLGVTPRFVRGPDFFLGPERVWWDVTTQGQWSRHVRRYDDFGEGTILDTAG